METLSNNRERLRMRQSSKGSQNGRVDQPLRGGQVDDLQKSSVSGAAFSYKRDRSRDGSYKRDSNSPLRQKDVAPPSSLKSNVVAF